MRYNQSIITIYYITIIIDSDWLVNHYKWVMLSATVDGWESEAPVDRW